MHEKDHTLDDRDLALSAGRGDEKAFEGLIGLYGGRVLRLALRYAGGEEDAKELAQLIWIKVWDRLPRYRGESQFFTWMYRLAVRRSLDFIRQRQRRREVEFPEDRDVRADPGFARANSLSGHPDRDAVGAEVQERFAAALEELSPEHRMALVLREVDGLSYEEIGRMMKCRAGTVMSRIYYARKAMREKLEGLR